MRTSRAAGAADAGIIGRLPLFQELMPDQVADIVAGSREQQLDKGELLFQKGDAAQGFYVVIKGQIKLAFPSVHGNDKVVEILGPGQSFGEALMFMDRAYPVFAEAVTDAVLLQIPRRPINELLDRDATFARAMLAGLAKRLHSLVQDVEAYSVRSSAQRLIGYLLRHSDDVDSGPVELELPTTKSVIASRLNVTPETLSRVFHELKESGLIEIRGRHVTIRDIERLRDYEQ